MTGLFDRLLLGVREDDGIRARRLRLPGNWADSAACRDMTSDIFFPEQGNPCSAARRVCATCVVRDECLEHALAFNERHGVWGGASERERRRIQQERRRQAA